LERLTHAFLHRIARVSVIHRALKNEHSINSDANNKKGDKLYQRRQGETHVATEAEGGEYGEGNVGETCNCELVGVLDMLRLIAPLFASLCLLLCT
jgi:hypothetical protein